MTTTLHPLCGTTYICNEPVAILYEPVEVPPNNNSYFAILPEEIIVKVLECCDSETVLACQLTCRALRNFIVNSTSLRYKLALAENGLCDGPKPQNEDDGTGNGGGSSSGGKTAISTAEKMELLSAYASAWQNLSSAQPVKASMLIGWSAPVAVSANVVVFSKRHNNNDNGGTGEPTLDLLVYRVPSALRQIECAHWTLSLPANVNELCIDVAQDLLIYVLDGTFHACMLSSGAAHPLVEHEGFFKMWSASRRFDVSNLSVCGDYVAAVTRTYFISVWNWKTGDLVSDLKVSEVRFSSFEFIDEHHIAYAVSKEDSVYVYDLRRHGIGDHGEKVESEPICFQLELPPIDRATTSRYIQFRRNALPTREQAWGVGSAGSGTPPPFQADPRERLVVLRIVTSPVERGEEQFELHVPTRVLLERSAALRGSGGATLPWSAWRDLVRVTSSRRLPYIVPAYMVAYGRRVVSHPPDWDRGVLHVDSYSPRRTRRGYGDDDDARGTRHAVKLPEELAGKENLLSALCEDALLCYKLDSSLSRISHAYWYTF
ncbi:hypothetical protein B0F90DRAFT_1730927 [Multifurca ochricompacta]|uniref:F-box domain-containing protein n=1 Tax=Multifurca ochricompacta TaxID=376703 RepID=A0AAD4M1M6_9AGAM|nr:hypothetical protein B0F90DRAFT_1730927 [Multifurca ochricompacta]